MIFGVCFLMARLLVNRGNEWTNGTHAWVCCLGRILVGCLGAFLVVPFSIIADC